MRRRPVTLTPPLAELPDLQAATPEPPHQRRVRYLRLAMKARERAEYCADQQLRERFLSISKVWQGLADFIDRSHSN
jgi:hypothetical protein